MRPSGDRRGISAASDLFCTLNKLLDGFLEEAGGVRCYPRPDGAAWHYSLPFRESSIKDCMDTHSA